MKTFVISIVKSRKVLALSSALLIAAWGWTISDVAARGTDSASGVSPKTESVVDKPVEQDIREKLFLHRLSMGV